MKKVNGIETNEAAKRAAFRDIRQDIDNSRKQLNTREKGNSKEFVLYPWKSEEFEGLIRANSLKLCSLGTVISINTLTM